MTLDQRMVQDLTERLKGLPISSAVKLSAVAALQPNVTPGFSTMGLPGYFCGNRNAATVFVQLNPGIDAKIADNYWNNIISNYNKSSLSAFITDYIKVNCNFTNGFRYDPFDVKQAAF